jgi:hypothetical protein
MRVSTATGDEFDLDDDSSALIQKILNDAWKSRPREEE